MDHTQKSSYLFSIDALRVIAIIAVVVIHQTTKTIQVADHNVTIVPFSLFLNQVARFAVPLFFMISGFVLELNNKDVSYSVFFKKRAVRVIIPFVTWSAFYILAGNLDVSKLFSVSFIQNLIFGSASYHLYFIPTLILFYLAFPLLHAFIKYLKNPKVLLLIVAIGTLLQLKDYYFGQFDLQYSLRIALLNLSIFILGMGISHHKDSIYKIVKKYFAIFLGSTIITAFVVFFHVYFLTITKNTSSYIYNQYGPLYYIFTVLLASTLFYLFEKTQFMRKTFINLSKYSFFVFFIHVYVLDLVWNIFLAPLIKSGSTNFLKQFWFDPLLIAVVCIVSFGTAFIIHKVPYASKITG